jgi:hypothetical protein
MVFNNLFIKCQILAPFSVGTAGDGPYVTAGIIACNRIITVEVSWT